jgi:hypothetical protein
MHSGPDPASRKWRIALPLMPGNQQKHPVASIDGALQRPIDRLPSAIEAMSMKIECAIRLYPAAAQAPIPAAIQCRLLMRH